MAKPRKRRRRAPRRGPQPKPPLEAPRAAFPIAVLLLLLATFAAYASAYDNTFVYWDDHIYILFSDLMRPAETDVADVFRQVTFNNFHPLTTLTWRWNARECAECLFVYDARPFLIGNVLLHALNSLLVFLLTWRLAGRNFFVGLFSSVLFALHPMHVESVAWISERKDVLCVLFLLGGSISYDRFLDGRYADERRPESGWLAATFVCFLLACLSKSAAVVFPLLMLVLDFWRNPTASPIRALRETLEPRKLAVVAPFLAISLVFGLLALQVQAGGNFYGLLAPDPTRPAGSALNDRDVFSWVQRIQFAGYGFCMYLVKLVAPTGLSPWHPYPVSHSYWPTTFAAFGILAGVAWSLRTGKLLAFGVAFYLFAMAPTLQFVSFGVAIIAERYTYLAYVGPAFVIAVWLSRWAAQRNRRNRTVAIYAFTAILAAVWGVQTHRQVDVWQDSESLWTRVIERYPEQPWPYETRADYYSAMAEYWVQVGGAERALEYSEKADADRATMRKLQARF